MPSIKKGCSAKPYRLDKSSHPIITLYLESNNILIWIRFSIFVRSKLVRLKESESSAISLIKTFLEGFFSFCSLMSCTSQKGGNIWERVPFAHIVKEVYLNLTMPKLYRPTRNNQEWLSIWSKQVQDKKLLPFALLQHRAHWLYSSSQCAYLRIQFRYIFSFGKSSLVGKCQISNARYSVRKNYTPMLSH